MKILKIVLVIVVSLVIAAVGVAWHAGSFKSVSVVERTMGGHVVAGADHVGPYSGVYPTMQEVDQKLKGIGVTCERGFGIYYDDPKTTPEKECRSYVGNVLEDESINRIAEVTAIGLKVDSIERLPSLVVEFDINSSLSYMIGPGKAYPALTEAMEEKGIIPVQVYEYYDMPAKKAYYVMQYRSY